MIIATIHSFDSIEKFKSEGIDALIVGLEGLSIRSSIVLTRSELVFWKQKCAEVGMRLYVNALKLFMEEEMDDVQEALRYCKELAIDGIYFSDEGLLYAALKLHMEDRLVYQPETLITNHFDAKFYLDQGIQSVSLAHELSLDEIRGIVQVQPIEVLISGYFSILYSKRYLITNYLDAMHEDTDGNGYSFDIIEQTRSDRMPIVQDGEGTHIYSACPIQSFQVLDELKQLGIYRFRIDSIFKDDQWTIEQLHAYRCHQPLASGSDHWYYQETVHAKEKES